MADDDPKTRATLYLNIIWHQHQPMYVDPGSDQLQGPWVRTHGTKDYYDMVSMLERYPNIHFTVNLTSSLLIQLDEYYVKRLRPFVDLKRNRIDAKKFLARYGGKTDPWIDLALKPTKDFSSEDMAFLLTNVWNAFGISDVILDRFPAYKALKEKFKQSGAAALTEQDLREIKFWFFLAYFDPDFLERKNKLANRTVLDLTDLLEKVSDGTYRLKKTVTEDDCNRIVAETYKILSAIIPIHQKMLYKPGSHKGQVEIITTPYTHPILPLIYDSDLSKLCQPNDQMPSRFHFPDDADAHVGKAVQYFRQQFGKLPTGMWPAEGSVAHDIIGIFGKNGIRWIATDEKILHRSRPAHQPKYYPYALFADHGAEDSVVIVFRDTELSDKIGFVYKEYEGEQAADDFIRHVLSYAPPPDEPDRVLTVILDGENAWEWYRRDNDGKGFQNALYRKLTKFYEAHQVITVTMTEYLRGNPHRNVPAHPIESLPKLEWLWPGSWINANYDTWIGEDEENKAWEYLLTAREDLEQSGVKRPTPHAPIPRQGTKARYAYQAWESLYAAEGSDWFWWYGTDQTAPAGDKPFDISFITHLRNIYSFVRRAGGKMPDRKFEPIVSENGERRSIPQATMAQSTQDLVRVIFECDACEIYVRKAIFITGNHPALADWSPNLIRMRTNGSSENVASADGIWRYEAYLPPGYELEYKYTNSGATGQWDPGDEAPSVNRKVRINEEAGGTLILRDTFGRVSG